MIDHIPTDPLVRQKRLVEQHPRNELARFSLGKALFDRGDYLLAKEQFEVALSQRDDWMVVHILLGRCHHSLGEKAKATFHLERARTLAINQNHQGPLTEIDVMLSELK